MLWLLLAACNPADTDTDIPIETRDPRFDAVAATLEQQRDASTATAVSIAVYDGGEVVWAEAFGPTRADGSEPATASTLFQLGSTTKMFTSTALLQGVDAGLYSMDDALPSLLPDLVMDDDDIAMWSQITPHHLLSQQTGLVDFVDWDEDAGVSLASIALEDYPAERPFMNPPGAFFNYSNPNFSYAGLVRATASERDLADILRDDVFSALGMPRTTVVRSDVAADGDYALGTGFIIGANGQPRRGPIDDLDDVPHSPFGMPAGVSTWTTPTELMQMADFLMHGNEAVLSDPMRTAITAPQVPLLSTPDDVSYGYGVFVHPGYITNDGYLPTTVWEHGGNTLQYTCIFYMLPELDYAVAILSSGYATDFYDTLDAAVALAPGLPEPVDPPSYTLDTARFADHVGRYEGTENIGPMVVEEVDGGLQWTLPALDAIDYPYENALRAVSSTLFIATIDGSSYDITFVGEPGEPSAYIRNRSFVGIRDDAPIGLRPFANGPVSLEPVPLGPPRGALGPQ